MSDWRETLEFWASQKDGRSQLGDAARAALAEIEAALAEIDRLHAEREATRELLVRADSYLSLLWHRYVAPERKDADLSFNVGRTIGDLRVKSETP